MAKGLLVGASVGLWYHPHFLPRTTTWRKSSRCSRSRRRRCRTIGSSRRPRGAAKAPRMRPRPHRLRARSSSGAAQAAGAGFCSGGVGWAAAAAGDSHVAAGAAGHAAVRGASRSRWADGDERSRGGRGHHRPPRATPEVGRRGRTLRACRSARGGDFSRCEGRFRGADSIKGEHSGLPLPVSTLVVSPRTDGLSNCV